MLSLLPHLCIMTREEALVILASDEFNFASVALEKTFEHKQYLLRTATVPQVFKQRADKLRTLQEAVDALDTSRSLANETPEPTVAIDWKRGLHVVDLIFFYRQYENQLSQFKLLLMQSQKAGSAATYAMALAQLEDLKLSELFETFKELELSFEDTVKLSDFVNSGEILHELKNVLFETINSENLKMCTALQRDVLRSRKYVTFTTSKK